MFVVGGTGYICFAGELPFTGNLPIALEVLRFRGHFTAEKLTLMPLFNLHRSRNKADSKLAPLPWTKTSEPPGFAVLRSK
jgi:hypothetical protein